jgi:purine-binding chemotaxis protein CheW
MSDDTTGRADAPAPGAPAHDHQFVTFSVAGELFAVPMGPVQEIIRVPAVARMPLAPAALDGLANLRGRVLPIIDLRRLFGAPPREHDDATRAVVIDIGQPLGFVVDDVASVIGVEPGQVEPADAIRTIVDARFLTGVIRRPGADGTARLLLTLDFAQLVREHFETLARQARTGSAPAGAAADAAPPGASAAGTAAQDELRLVSFSVDAQEYAIDIGDVREIVQLPERITALPGAPAHLLGVISLRDRLLPLVSLRRLFTLGDQSLSDQHRIVVVAQPGGALVGLVTDSVKEVLSVPRSQTEPVPPVLARQQGMEAFSTLCRLDEGRRLVSIIATDRLLGSSAIHEAVDAARAATATDATEESTMRRSDARADGDDDAQVVVFRLGAEEFGVPIMSVQEIVRVPEALTRVPRTPAFVEGVINLRGTVLPVIDQRTRLGLPRIERNEGQRIMVYTLAGTRTGFIVDSVAEVLRIPRGRIDEAPGLSDEQTRLIGRIAKLDGDRRMVMLIDPANLLGQGEAAEVRGMAGDAAGAADAPGHAPLARAA